MIIEDEGYPYLAFHLQECLKTPPLTFTCSYHLWVIHIHIICLRLVTSNLLVAFLYLRSLRRLGSSE